MSTNVLVRLFPARARRRFQRGLKRKPVTLFEKLRETLYFEHDVYSVFWWPGTEMEVPDGEKPLRTHLRNMIILH